MKGLRRRVSLALRNTWLRLRPFERGADWERLASISRDVVAFSHPEYLGVTQSTRSLFEHWYPLAARDVGTAARRGRLADAVCASGAGTVVLSGFAPGYAELVAELRRRPSKPRILALWHGSALQNVEDCNWRHLRAITELARRGEIARVGFFKEGMAEVVARGGVPATFVMNCVDAIPSRASAPIADGKVHLGFFCAGESWRKNPYAMLSGAALVPRAVVSGVLDARACEWCDLIRLERGCVRPDALSRDELLVGMARMHCNLYLTLSECSPLLPLESLSVGVPCLISRTSHLFRDDPLLSDKLVVTDFDDPGAIARSIEAALECRSEIVTAYAKYAVGYNRLARESLDRFLAE